MLPSGAPYGRRPPMNSDSIATYIKQLESDLAERNQTIAELQRQEPDQEYRDKKGNTSKQWERYQREWANPYIFGSKMKAV
jgi:hypothetical protein